MNPFLDVAEFWVGFGLGLMDATNLVRGPQALSDRQQQDDAIQAVLNRCASVVNVHNSTDAIAETNTREYVRTEHSNGLQRAA